MGQGKVIKEMCVYSLEKKYDILETFPFLLAAISKKFKLEK
jgi:hypothetical protein